MAFSLKPNDVFGKCLLDKLLNKSKLSQTDLAIMTNISKSQLNKYIHNERTMSLATAKIISSALKCHIEDLYEWKI